MRSGPWHDSAPLGRRARPALPDAAVPDVRTRDPGQPLASQDAGDDESSALPGAHVRRMVLNLASSGSDDA